MIKWLKKRRQQRNREIAEAVYKELTTSQSWEKFLPPVVIRDRMYMVTESGSIYAMQWDELNDMEQIIKIHGR